MPALAENRRCWNLSRESALVGTLLGVFTPKLASRRRPASAVAPAAPAPPPAPAPTLALAAPAAAPTPAPCIPTRKPDAPSVVCLFRFVPAAGLATMVFVYVASISVAQAWPLLSVSRYGGKPPAVITFRICTAIGAILTCLAGWTLRRRSRAIAAALAVAAVGLLGLGVVSVYDNRAVHRGFSALFFVGLCVAQVAFERRASDEASGQTYFASPLFRRDARPPVNLLRACVATIPLLVLAVVAAGVAGHFYDVSGSVEHLLLAECFGFMVMVSFFLAADEEEMAPQEAARKQVLFLFTPFRRWPTELL